MDSLGDKQLGEVFDFFFNTVRDTGAPYTLAGTPSLCAYLGNSTTQITTGLTLTADFDGVTGLNHVRVDTSAGYARKQDVSIVIAAGTVNSISVVGAKVAKFTIEKQFARGVLATGRAVTVTSNTVQMEASPVPGTDALRGNVMVIREASTTGRLQSRLITSNAGVTVTVDPPFTITLAGNVDYELLAAPPGAATDVPDVNVKTMSGLLERNLTFLAAFRRLLAMVVGNTQDANTTSEKFYGLRNDGTPGKLRVTRPNDGTDRTGTPTFDDTDD